jgi:hypothetical protein
VSKADEIRALRAEGKAPPEISRLVERSLGYVHTVLSKDRERVRKNGLIRKPGRPKKDAAPGGFGERPESR